MSTATESRVLVVLYSRTGTTRKIGAEIAQRCGADMEEVRDTRSREGVLGYLRSALEALRKTPAKIQSPRRRWRDYEVVVLGTPVWGGHPCSPVRAYLAQQSDPHGRVAFFCTMGGRGAESVFAELAQLTRMTPTATLALTAAQVAQGVYGDLLDSFVRKIAGARATVSETTVESRNLAGAH